MQPIKLKTGETLDAQAVNLMRSIREKESGGNYNAVGDVGTSTGAFQFQAPTWKRYAKEVLGDENAKMDKANQNKVVYGKIKKWKDEGKSPEWIAAAWNSGEGKAQSGAWKTNKGTTTINGQKVEYDTPKYVQDVISIAKRNKANTGGTVSPETQAPVTEQPVQEGGAMFKYNEGDSGLTAGLKALGNTPQSAVNFAKGAVQSVNPVNTIGNISQIGDEFSALKKDKGFFGALGATLKEIPKATYETLVPQGIRQAISGDVSGAAKTFTEDPFGQAAPIVLAAKGGAKLADTAKSKAIMKDYVANIGENVKNRQPIPKPTHAMENAIDTGISKTAGLITKPVEAITAKTVGMLKGTTGSLLSKFTGMDPQTIQQIVSNPKEFSKLAREEMSRGNLANDVKKVIDVRLKELSETGKEYNPIKESGEIASVGGRVYGKGGVVPSYIDDTLQKHGLAVEKGGKIKATTESTTRNTQDINALNKFYKDWGHKRYFTPKEFLNMRSDLAELARFDKVTGTGKTSAIEGIAKDMRAAANEQLRPQFTGLKELDDVFGPEKEFLKAVRKDFIDANGNLKDNAPSRIANSPNKAELTKRLEKLMPDIGQRIEILKAAEDIERASGIKVGTYGTVIPAGIGLAAGGPLGAILAHIIATPANAVAILRAAGYTDAAVIKPIVQTLKVLGGGLNNSTGLLNKSVQSTGGLINRNSEMINQ